MPCGIYELTKLCDGCFVLREIQIVLNFDLVLFFISVAQWFRSGDPMVKVPLGTATICIPIEFEKFRRLDAFAVLVVLLRFSCSIVLEFSRLPRMTRKPTLDRRSVVGSLMPRPADRW